MCEINEIMNDIGTRQYEVAHIPTCTMKKYYLIMDIVPWVVFALIVIASLNMKQVNHGTIAQVMER